MPCGHWWELGLGSPVQHVLIALLHCMPRALLLPRALYALPCWVRISVVYCYVLHVGGLERAVAPLALLCFHLSMSIYNGWLTGQWKWPSPRAEGHWIPLPGGVQNIWLPLCTWCMAECSRTKRCNLQRSHPMVLLYMEHPSSRSLSTKASHL